MSHFLNAAFTLLSNIKHNIAVELVKTQDVG